ncbi:MAG: leucine-rich repeat domain-containing protein [Prevotella sp.]|nr:leucine-rich repeat domain-containing protein [Candidatus Equicola stercoris]
MKKMFLMSLMSIMSLTAMAFSFSAENSDGKTIYYNISKDGTTCEVTCKSRNSYAGVVFIPEMVTNNGKTLKVTAIGKDAFRDSKELLLVFIPNTIRSIGAYAFSGCVKLKNLELPNSVTTIGKCAFENCKMMTRAKFGKYLMTIGVKAFCGCSYLAYVTFRSPAKIQTQAFDNCEKLIYIYCNTAVAPTIEKPEDTFNYNVYRTSILFVPEENTDNYKDEKGWKFFRYIRELD